jgi:serine/threonine protein kinase
VVADFGIAHFEEEIIATAVETKMADKLANIRYSAPEQRTKGAAVDKRADIYTLGLILNEMFTGLVPEGSGHATIAAVAPQYAYLDDVVETMRQQKPVARPASIAEMKKELIGRKNEFVAFQELDAKRRTVINSAGPHEVAPVNPIEVSWEKGVLTIELDRAPEARWIQRFQQPPFSTSYLMTLPPAVYYFQGSTVRVSVEEEHVQKAIDQFKQWTPQVTQVAQEEVNQVVIETERRQRKILEQEVAAAEAKARVNKNLKL